MQQLKNLVFFRFPTLNTFVYTGEGPAPLPEKSAICAPGFTRPSTFKSMISICQRHCSSQNSNSHITFFSEALHIFPLETNSSLLML